MTIEAQETTLDVPLFRLAQARSGDKNDTSDITVFMTSRELFEWIEPRLTEQVVKEFMAPLVHGDVQRYLLPRLYAFKFVCHQALGGGGSSSLRGDNLGKSMASALLRWVATDVPSDLARTSPLFDGPPVPTPKVAVR
ncbi:hypothetical protein ASC77_19580 [Nocardioides sp. Root1257]|uniref:AtuA-related protein n=1 Tax=unclassified Nocardioides TaxID=2615069 RepID=UPI0006FEE9D2|nr:MULTISPECIES: hypothetical protein [unclassified Nocardioides]KQW45236.1 hypothetical protein ASC77_19580 [Nocardioides sp. Root1257]KRC46077.1 hypothetical protein ASE24_15640 [Nocardioides sp. Root224]